MIALKERFRRYWSTFGPGLITGAADDDPSGIATYSQTGAVYGFQFLWAALITFPLMGVVQEMCARIGMVSGRGLAANIRSLYSPATLYGVVVALVLVNTFNIATDIRAMAQAIQLLAPSLSLVFLVSIIVLVSIVLELWVSYPVYARYLKYLGISLMLYIVAAFLINIDWQSALYYTVIPHFEWTKDQIFILCALLGTTISPYLFFWQASQEVEEEIREGRTSMRTRKDANADEIHFMRFDTWMGMFFSNIVMYFIILVCAGTLHLNGITNIESAADAARALEPIVGSWAYVIFALGVIGVGFMAIGVLAGSSAYAIAETMHWREGLYRKPAQAYGFYGVIVVSMLGALILDITKLNAIKGLIYAAVGNGIVAPIIIFFIVAISSKKHVMGQWANTIWESVIGWTVFLLMAVVGIAAVIGLWT